MEFSAQAEKSVHEGLGKWGENGYKPGMSGRRRWNYVDLYEIKEKVDVIVE